LDLQEPCLMGEEWISVAWEIRGIYKRIANWIGPWNCCRGYVLLSNHI
jgi:hypothetical protein